VIGFSLPPTDTFFQYLYALGSVGQPLRRFQVFDIAPLGGEIEQRFRGLLGPGAEQRFRYSQTPFDGAIRMMAAELGLKIN